MTLLNHYFGPHKVLFSFFLKNPSKQPQLALELLNRLISHADYSDEKTIELAVYLWNISKRGVNVIRFQVN